MGTPLKNPPVYFTVAQVRFNSVLKLAEYLPAIQELFRKAGYPAFKEQRQTVVELVPHEGQITPASRLLQRFMFGSAKRTHVFLLDQSSLTLQSTAYDHFEAFSKQFIKGLEIVHEVVQLAFTERIGLRYLDRVTPQADDRLEDYLHPEVLGLSSRLKGDSRQSYSETLSVVGDIQLRSRVAIQDGELAFPPDLMPGDMALNPRVGKYVGRNAILDNDGSVAQRTDFDIALIAKQLDEIHVVIGDAFRAVATEHAFKVWGQ
jgi:uncharacterized protein (TIGR04255 family)